MEENPYFLGLLAALLYGIVGLRLFALSCETRARPERLLALHYLANGVSYLLYEVPYILEREEPWAFVAARIIYTLGVVPLLLFTYEVFRKGSRWAIALLFTIAALLFSGAFFSSLEGDVEGLNVSSFWFWCDWIGYTLPYVWIGAEGWIAYGSAKKRVVLGLTEPAVAHRFLLWAWFGILAALGGISLIPLSLEYAVTGLWPVWADYLSGGLEVAATVAIWLAFFPPRFYRRWVDRTATIG
jgi:hypothetical protein